MGVDLGVETARACVTVWEYGKQRTRRGLDARGAERAIDEALKVASRFEVDVGNLGRVVVTLTRGGVEDPCERRGADRLMWHDEVASISSQLQPNSVPTLVEQAGARALVVRRLGGAALVRARLALRRRLETGGARP